MVSRSIKNEKTPMVKKEVFTENQALVPPFLKWAGGKRWLVSSYPELFPQNYERYLEPFLGSGAVYFHLRPEKALLSDANFDLINCYNTIKNNWKAVFKTLKIYHKNHSKELYYEIRPKLFKSDVQKAAQFIYLNRTCWNGLYRVNLDGQFNVPIGTKKNVLLESDDFELVSKQLLNTDLFVSDFEEIINMAEKGDFLFVDPPYTVKHNLNGFIKYNNQLFSWEDQIRLRDCVKRASARGVLILLTNADHSSVRELYSGIGQMIKLERMSVISGNSDARGKYSELIVKNY